MDRCVDCPRPCPSSLQCGWTEHDFKHSPHEEFDPADTIDGPARYAWPCDVRAIETKTVERADYCHARSPYHFEYVREVGAMIGWHEGKKATVSYAECSGGTAGRTFHGRPMLRTDKKVRKITAGDPLPAAGSAAVAGHGSGGAR